MRGQKTNFDCLLNGLSSTVTQLRLTLVQRHNFTPLTGGIGTVVSKLILREICRCGIISETIKVA